MTMNRNILTTLALGLSLATIGVAAAEPIPYSTMQVISNGDSDAVVAEKAALLRQAPAMTAGSSLKIGVSRDQKEMVVQLIP